MLFTKFNHLQTKLTTALQEALTHLKNSFLSSLVNWYYNEVFKKKKFWSTQQFSARAYSSTPSSSWRFSLLKSAGSDTLLSASGFVSLELRRADGIYSNFEVVEN